MYLPYTHVDSWRAERDVGSHEAGAIGNHELSYMGVIIKYELSGRAMCSVNTRMIAPASSPGFVSKFLGGGMAVVRDRMTSSLVLGSYPSFHPSEQKYSELTKALKLPPG